MSEWPSSSLPHTRGSIQIVTVDHSRGRNLTELLRGAGYEVQLSSNSVAGADVLESAVEAVVLIGSKPNWQIERICQICSAIRSAAPNLPMIVVGPNDLEAKVRLFKLGADDYVVDPFDRMEFLARIKCWIRKLRTRPP